MDCKEALKDLPPEPMRIKRAKTWGAQAYLYVCTCQQATSELISLLHGGLGIRRIPLIFLEDGHAKDGDYPADEGYDDDADND